MVFNYASNKFDPCTDSALMRFECLACFVFIIIFVGKVVTNIWWRPHRLKAYWESYGVLGPPYKLLYGNTKEIVEMMMQANSSLMGFSHDILPRAISEIYYWTKTYGRNFLYCSNLTPRIVIPEPNLIRDLLAHQSKAFEKPKIPIQLRQLCGDCLTNFKGTNWVRQGIFISPSFHLEILRAMVPMVGENTTDMLQRCKISLLLLPKKQEMVIATSCGVATKMAKRLI